MPHPALGVLNIPFVAGNDVDMDMENTLSGRWPHINADIVAIRAKLFIYEFFFLCNEVHAGVDLFRRQVEKTNDMTTHHVDLCKTGMGYWGLVFFPGFVQPTQSRPLFIIG